MGFKDRLAKARKESADVKKGFMWEEGDYEAKFKDWSFGKSQNGDDMFTLKFKVSDAPTDEMFDLIEEKDKRIEMKLLPRVGFQLDKVLDFVDGSGCDIDECDEDDKTFKDIKSLLSKIEDKAPKVKLYASRAKDKKNTNWSFSEIEQVFTPKPEAPDFTRAELIDGGWTDEAINDKYGKDFE